MNDRMFYPAVFHSAEEGGFWITFPDFENIFTQGENMEDAYSAASDALGLEITDLLEQGGKLPEASSFQKIRSMPGETIVVIEFDMAAYKRRINKTAVKKTLSIPGWLNEAAVEKGINFSSVLQKALIRELQILE